MAAAPSLDRADDVALARRAASGERGAQRDLFEAHKRGVHHTLFRILGGNGPELEDLVQDAFLEIFRGLASFRGDSGLARWCQTIATRVAYLAIARRKPATVELSVIEDVVASGEDGRRTVELRQAVRRMYVALDRVDARQRIAFALVMIDGRSVAEVAQLTEATMVTVRTRVWRAKRDLMKRAARDPVLESYLNELQAEVNRE